MYVGVYYYISTPMRVHWCVLLYINTNESTYVGVYYYISTPMRVHWCVLLYINTNESMYVGVYYSKIRVKFWLAQPMLHDDDADSV